MYDYLEDRSYSGPIIFALYSAGCGCCGYSVDLVDAKLEDIVKFRDKLKADLESIEQTIKERS